MKSLILALLAATVSAEAEIRCKPIEGVDPIAIDAYGVASCGLKGTEVVNADAGK